MSLEFSIETSPISVEAPSGESVQVTQTYSTPLTFSIGTQPSSGGTLGGGTSGGDASQTQTEATQSYYGLRKPRGAIAMMSCLESGSVVVSGKSTAGALSVMWWDGQVSSSSGDLITLSRAVPQTGAWSGAAPKIIYAWSGSRTQAGGLTSFGCSSCGLKSLDVSECGDLVSLNFSRNQVTHVSFHGTDLLEVIDCHDNWLEEMDLYPLLELKELSCHSNRLKSLDVTRSRKLSSLQCNDNEIEVIALTGLAELASLYCHYNRLSFLDLRPCAAMKTANCMGNLLTSVRATGLQMNGLFGLVVANNFLSGPSLNTIYQDLSPTTGGQIYVSGNPGTSSDDPAIATAKGYVVYG